MRMLKMSWNTEEGRLVCRWVESEASEKSVDPIRNLLRPSNSILRTNVHEAGWAALFRVGQAA